MTWIKGYLYSTMKDSCKMEILSENEDVKVRFIPTSLSEDGQLPVDNILQLIQVIVGEHEDDVEIYVALNNDDMTDNYVLMNILDIIGTMHEDGITVRNTFTTTEATNSMRRRQGLSSNTAKSTCSLSTGTGAGPEMN